MSERASPGDSLVLFSQVVEGKATLLGEKQGLEISHIRDSFAGLENSRNSRGFQAALIRNF